jgi:hypothetical protein
VAGKGGYQAPRNPAPASGPGRLARRTDGGAAQSQPNYTGLPYGDGQALAAQAAGAPMVQADPVPAAPVRLTGLDAPTERPDEHVMAGVDRGPGPGSEVLAQRGGYGSLADLLNSLAGADVTGTIAALAAEARQRGL